MAKEILVVDDDPDYCQLTRVRLEKSGFKVTIVPNGAQALALFENEYRPDLVILDVEMPGMNGLTTLLNLKVKKMVTLGNRPQAIPVIVATGLQSEKLREIISEHDVNAFLKKPYSAEELINKIKELIEKESG
ncbi:MAG: hypothetical protein A3G33_05710 [Omnitrophica bacterium RIFCSPLOWO2_12_FULL_44_17]|uniref:Response regulatory domain-containing protein n=1 Tax=Candidatus Danuiimicrobium aquiferis TaxID=1801832 RepID=A0A1G1L365_9BACT|nr:MAG: hypothetical protein A3B72_05190 [Omnitrophica bacterium RIFCSPHIGHO2_02_FULL_45_28]OGW89889.1 MAG: hypothetical protein A3E74_01820 [Omnitrophica bacterium RIFCSPHIGHO2_12_FULL_44_12]OGW99567.1 MAG: hypothetical protein A3G33_05710 [Omnitrophica bacterium RIFCSPLOWO2_12_FULL_44_17]OGX04016.1 MAG: hypothetical protein A3J12_06250 [Omnitrophica bacterium RIFCSPLOWO2_02_FULL_44_11]